MVAAPRKPRKQGRPRRSRPAVHIGSGRVVAAIGLLLVGLAVVGYLLWRSGMVEPPRAPHDPGTIVREVAARAGIDGSRVAVETLRDRNGPLWSITVHAPASARVDTLVFDLEAAVHNLAGRLEPRPLVETGGYGLARLEGEVEGKRWRVVVLREEPPVQVPGPTKAPAPGTPQVGRLAIVLDDAGDSLDIMPALDRLPAAVAVAVLPNAVHSAEVARAIGARGRETLLHLPMEPLPNHGPGPGPDAITVGLSVAEVEARVERALDVVPSARGVNNHMGSRATRDPATMWSVMEVLRRRGLFFLDSRTTSESIAERSARESGVASLHRDVFLDVVDEPDAVRRALEAAVARARAVGRAVAIGHVHPVTLEVLAAELARPPAGLRLVRPSELVRPGE